MALNAGDASCTTGLSKRIFDNWTADPSSGFMSPLTPAADGAVKSLCYAVAKAVVDEIQANAHVVVSDGVNGTVS